MVVFLGLLFVASFVFFLYYFYWFLFWYKNAKAYRLADNKQMYFSDLEKRYKRCREGRRKNFLLYLSVLTLRDLGKDQEAEKLMPFLKKDLIFGVKK